MHRSDGCMLLRAFLREPPKTDAPQVVATTYYRTFSHAHPVLKGVRAGNTVVTKTFDAAAMKRGLSRSGPEPTHGTLKV